MNSFSKTNIKEISIIQKKSYINQKLSSILINTVNNRNRIRLPNNFKNKSRNIKSKLLLTDSNSSNEKFNHFIKTLLKTNNSNSNSNTNTNTINKNITPLLLNISNKNNKNIKKIIYRKKLKELFKNIDKSGSLDYYKNKTYLFDRINFDIINIPKIKSQDQLNYYLINDFKEIELPINEINKSLRHKIIYDEFGLYKAALQEKKCIKNLNLIKEYKQKYNLLNEKNSSYDSSSDSNNSISKPFVRKNKKMMTCYNPNVFFNEVYKSYHKIKENESISNDSNKTNNIKIIKPRKSLIFQKPIFTNSKEIIPFRSYKKRKSEIQKSKPKNINKSILNTSNSFSTTNISLHNIKLYQISNNNPYYERLYKAQKKHFKHYLKKAQNLRAKTYVDQLKKIDIEKEKEYKENKNINLVKLNEDELLLEIKKKNAFLNSLGIIGRKNLEIDDDVDEDNFKKIKSYHMKMGMGAFYTFNLKFRVDPSYIKKDFRKKTMDRYKGSKGIYFGPKVKDINFEQLKINIKNKKLIL